MFDDEEFFEEDAFIDEEEVEQEKVELPEHLKRQTKFGENREEVQMQQAQKLEPADDESPMDSDLPLVDEQAQKAALFSLRHAGTSSHISGHAREMLATEDELDEEDDSGPDDLDDIANGAAPPPMA